MMTAATTALAPAPGSAWAPRRPGEPRPIDAGTFALAAMQSSPFWARRYTRWFLNSCQGLSTDTAETAELLVSELVTNAVSFPAIPRRASVFRPGERPPDLAVSAAFPRELAHRGIRYGHEPARSRGC